MDMSDKDTWTEGLRVVSAAPHIVWPLLLGTAAFVFWFRGLIDKATKNGLQAIINGRDAQIAGLTSQISVMQSRLDQAKEQQSYLASKITATETEVAKLQKQIRDNQARALVEATANSTASLVGDLYAASNRLGVTISSVDVRSNAPALPIRQSNKSP
jgi:septal ring factor EnvC (AmiA/AmiB activator)